MNPARGATPDSEAVASSEDERPWPSSTSFGRFPVNENSVPGLPGGIWSTQKRDSFKMAEAARRNAALEVRLGAANTSHNALRQGASPSPSANEGATSLPFTIPLQPVAKLGRSLSHSQGQREFPQSMSSIAGAGGQSMALPLGLLTEEVDTDSEPEIGDQLTHTTSHPPIGAVQRSPAFPSAHEIFHGRSNGKTIAADQPSDKYDRRFEAAFQELSFDPPQRRAQWQSSLGWDNLPNVNESRRHSLADIPTRRGSLVGGESGQFSRLVNREAAAPDMTNFTAFEATSADIDEDTAVQNARASRADALGIPAMYRAPHIRLSSQDLDARREQQHFVSGGTPWVQAGGRPRKQLYMVGFKCSRVDVFYLLDNTGLEVRVGDMVIVEADRGQDLGTVQHAKVSMEAAREFKRRYSEEQYKWLMMFSRNKAFRNNPNAQLDGEFGNGGRNTVHDAPTSINGMLPRDGHGNLKPKAIKRLASDHEIKMLADKEGNEAKAKRTCQQKVAHLRLEMEILDAEWQWDFQKLIFYYYADKYINFKDLITELYRIYKTRIWLSAINPASFSQHALSQAPSGIGPGAMAPYNPYNLSNSYTMSYGEDKDPYGAQMPYRIPYDTYTPNYPTIPGIVNSFPPPLQSPASPYMYFPAGPAPTAPGMPMFQDGQSSLSIGAPVPMSHHGMSFGRAPPMEHPHQTANGAPSPEGGVALPANSLNGTASATNGFPELGLWNAKTFQPSQTLLNHGRQASFPSPIGTRPGFHGQNGSHESQGEEQVPGMQQPGMRGFEHAVTSRSRPSISNGMASDGSGRRPTFSEQSPKKVFHGGVNPERIDSQNRIRHNDSHMEHQPLPNNSRAA